LRSFLRRRTFGSRDANAGGEDRNTRASDRRGQALALRRGSPGHLPSLPDGEAGCAELITADDGDDTQPTPAGLVTVDDDDDDGMLASTAGELPVTFGPVMLVVLPWIMPDQAKPTYQRLEHAPTVRAPPAARV
jgi:hypothetical protein